MSALVRFSPLVVAVLLAASPVAFADSTSPGKSSVFVSQSGELDSIELLGSIAKSKRGQILELGVFYTVSGGSCGSATQACISVVTVNGEPVQPTDGGCASCSSSGCTVSGSFWFDPEAEGQAGAPLDVRVVLADGGTQCPRFMAGSVGAKLVRK